MPTKRLKEYKQEPINLRWYSTCYISLIFPIDLYFEKRILGKSRISISPKISKIYPLRNPAEWLLDSLQ